MRSQLPGFSTESETDPRYHSRAINNLRIDALFPAICRYSLTQQSIPGNPSSAKEHKKPQTAGEDVNDYADATDLQRF